MRFRAKTSDDSLSNVHSDGTFVARNKHKLEIAETKEFVAPRKTFLRIFAIESKDRHVECVLIGLKNPKICFLFSLHTHTHTHKVFIFAEKINSMIF